MSERVSTPHSSFTPSGALRSLAYRSLWYGAVLLHKAATALTHTAAGLLSRKDLRTSTEELWSTFSLENEDVDAGLEPWERRLYEKLLHPSDRVLLVGCGAGRDLVALRERGHDVTGLDPARGIAERAQAHLARRGLSGRVVSGFVEDVDLDQTYDVTVLAGCCYSYVQGTDVRVATLSRIANRLAPGGRIAITYSRGAERARWSALLMDLSARIGRSDWRPEHGDTFERAYLTCGVLSYHHLFARGEVSDECARAGLRVVWDEDDGSVPWIVAMRHGAVPSDQIGHNGLADGRQE